MTSVNRPVGEKHDIPWIHYRVDQISEFFSDRLGPKGWGFVPFVAGTTPSRDLLSMEVAAKVVDDAPSSCGDDCKSRGVYPARVERHPHAQHLVCSALDDAVRMKTNPGRVLHEGPVVHGVRAEQCSGRSLEPEETFGIVAFFELSKTILGDQPSKQAKPVPPNLARNAHWSVE